MKKLFAVLFFCGAISPAFAASPLVVANLATLQGYSAATMSLNPNMYLSGTLSTSTSGAGHYTWIASGAGTPNGTTIIAPSDHAGTCSFGCMVVAPSVATGITVGTTTIGSGTLNGLLYDNAGVLGNLATANNGVLVTSGAGVPSISTTLPSGIAATNMNLTTPTLGAALATSINGNTITTGTGILTLGAGKTLTASNTLTLTGTDGSSVNFGAGGTVLYSGGSGFVSSLAGTANQITASASTGAVTLSLPSAITLPGTLTTTGNATVNGGTLTVNASGTNANIKAISTGGNNPALTFCDTTNGGWQWFSDGSGTAHLTQVNSGCSFVANWLNITNTGKLTVAATTASSSTTTGALVVSGGGGFAGNLNVGGTGTFSFNLASLASVYGLSNTSSFILGGLADTILSRSAAANWQFGAADAASPVAQTLSFQSVVAGTSNTAGVNTNINLSRGTGTGVGGNYFINCAPHGTTGSSQNALLGCFSINGDTGVSTMGSAAAGDAATFTNNGTTPQVGHLYTDSTRVGVYTTNNPATASGWEATSTQSRVKINGTTFIFGDSSGVYLPTTASATAAQTGTLCWNSTAGFVTYDPSLGCLASLEELKDIKAGGIPNALHSVLALKPFWYTWKKNTPEYKGGDHGVMPGLGARATEKVDPRLVAYDAKGNLKGVRYEQMTAVLVAAIQEQQKQIDGLKAANDNLARQVARLRAGSRR